VLPVTSAHGEALSAPRIAVALEDQPCKIDEQDVVFHGQSEGLLCSAQRRIGYEEDRASSRKRCVLRSSPRQSGRSECRPERMQGAGVTVLPGMLEGVHSHPARKRTKESPLTRSGSEMFNDACDHRPGPD